MQIYYKRYSIAMFVNVFTLNRVMNIEGPKVEY